MNDKLLTIIVKVRNGSDSIATGSAQIASGNQVLSPRTEEQASSLEQTAASMEQSTATIQQSADNTKQANRLAMGASTVSIRGGEVVGQEIQTMKGINDSRKMVADIISVIDSIAFQTTILALNAGAEAVRAPVERRRPDRAESVTRPEFGTKPKAEPPTLRTEAAVAKTGTADNWASL